MSWDSSRGMGTHTEYLPFFDWHIQLKIVLAEAFNKKIIN